ncbi:MAG: HD family hydrolase [Chloroflexi bacterium]|nr:HD family hydrolase [Chloroflexota bacterium]
MNITSLLNNLFHGNQLKRAARTGWVQRGVPNAENVAAHSYGVVYATLVLAQVIDVPIDLGRALAIAALHDLPEGLTTDIPTPAWRYLPPGIKTDVERGAMQEILADVPFAPAFMDLWEELHAGETAVAKLVHDADKIDMFVQAIVYEEQTGNRQLEEFWTEPYTFNYPVAQAIYNELRERRR